MALSPPSNRPLFTIWEKEEPKMSPDGEDPVVWRATVKNTTFGTELLKFLPPAEIAWYASDLDQGTTKTKHQGVIENNYAWWAPQQYLSYKTGVERLMGLNELPRTTVSDFLDQHDGAFDFHGHSWNDTYAHAYNSGNFSTEPDGDDEDEDDDVVADLLVHDPSGADDQYDPKVILNPNFQPGDDPSTYYTRNDFVVDQDDIGYYQALGGDDDQRTVGFYRFGGTHKGPARIFGTLGSGSNHGRINNFNLFRGLGGGLDDVYGSQALYGDKIYDYGHYNTWNAFEVSESNREDWDYGMSTGFQSVSALDGLTQWAPMNHSLDEISAQVARMKDAHFGFDFRNFSNEEHFHKKSQDLHRTVANPFSGTWYTTDGHPFHRQEFRNNDFNFGTVANHPYRDNTPATQAPNYYEIIMSGAWSQWMKPGQSGSIGTNPSGVDTEKFYHFLQAMLESRRRGLEAYRNLFGPARELLYEGEDRLDGKDGVTGEEHRRVGHVGESGEGPFSPTQDERDRVFDIAEGQAWRINNWYQNVTSRANYENTYYELLFFRIAHPLFNFFDAVSFDAGLGVEHSDGTEYGNKKTYTDLTEMMLFQRAAVKAAHRHLVESGRLEFLRDTQLNAQYQWMNSLPDPDDDDGGLLVDLVDMGHLDDKISQLLGDSRLGQDFLTNVNNDLNDIGRDNHVQIKRKYVEIYREAVWVMQEIRNIYQNNIPADPKFQPLSQNLKVLMQKVLGIVNAIAPIAEGLRGSLQDTEHRLEIPVIDFAHFNSDAVVHGGMPDIMDFELDYVPHSIWGNTWSVPAYDGFPQLQGTGLDWWGGDYRRPGLGTIWQAPPVVDSNGNVAAIDASHVRLLSGARDYYSDLDEFGRTSVDGNAFSFQNVDLPWALNNQRAHRVYVDKEGRGHLSPVNDGTRRGNRLEVDQNPAFAAAARYYSAIQQREEYTLSVAVANITSMMRYRIDKAAYDEATELFREEQRQADMEDQRAFAEAVARRRADEERARRAAEDRRQEERRRQNR